MNKPVIRILIALGLALLVLLVFSYSQQGTPWLLLMAFFAATLGPFMGLAYPFPVFYKVVYAISLLSCFAAIVFGFQARKRVVGQVTVVCGVLAWIVLGLVGLGTGT